MWSLQVPPVLVWVFSRYSRVYSCLWGRLQPSLGIVRKQGWMGWQCNRISFAEMTRLQTWLYHFDENSRTSALILPNPLRRCKRVSAGGNVLIELTMIKLFLANSCMRVDTWRKERLVLCVLLLHSVALFIFLLQPNYNSGADVLHPRVLVSSQPFRLLGFQHH